MDIAPFRRKSSVLESRTKQKLFEARPLIEWVDMTRFPEESCIRIDPPNTEFLMSNGKAPGSNGGIAEILKWGGQPLIDKLKLDFEMIWNGDDHQFPKAWRSAKVVTLFKGKGARSDPNNYRGIFLLEVTGKVFARIIVNRMTPVMEERLDPWQFGFRPKRGTMQAISILRRIQEEGRYKNQKVFVIFIDFEKAFIVSHMKFCGPA